MSKTNKCSLQNEVPSVCDDVSYGTTLVTERVRIPETNLHMNLVGKELCRHHYNKLIVNEKHRLESIAKKQQCAHPKHEENINDNKKGRPRKNVLVKIPQRLQSILDLPSDSRICNPCLTAMDRDEENQQSLNYQPPKQKTSNVNIDHFYAFRNDLLYSANEFKELETAFHEVCEELNQLKLSM
jgi:hypothetical protein